MKILKFAAMVIGAVALVATGIGFVAGAGGLASAFSTGVAAMGISSAAASVGIGLGTLGKIALAAVAIDASMIAGVLMPKPSQGGSQTKWKADPHAGLPYVMGRTLVAGNVIYRRGHGASNEYQTVVTVLSIGPIGSIDSSYMNRTTVAFSGAGAATGTYAGYIWQKHQLGACPESSALAPPVGAPPGWTAAHKLSGLAAKINTFRYDAKAKDGLTAVPQPADIVHGVLVYDPRQDSTYPGGAGSCRAFDEATYVWSEDPHLHGLTWALGRWQNGVRVAGIGTGSHVPGGSVRGIDVASFVEGANLNDARGWKLGGQVTTRADTAWNCLKLMLQAGGARPVLVGGVITAINRAPRVSLATIGPDDIAGEYSFAATQKRRGRINGIIPQYRSEAHDWEYVPAGEISVPAYVALDGDERTREVTYGLVQDVHQVAQLAAYDICDAREAGPGTIPLKPYWLNFRPGDCVTFAPKADWSIKVLIDSRSMELQQGIVTYSVRGETDGKHAFALGKTGVAPSIVSLSYSDGAPQPGAGDWTLTGVTLTANGASIPALVVAGSVVPSSADAAVFDFRPWTSGLGDEDNWAGASVEAPTITRKEITGLTPGTQYQVGVRYRVRGVIGPRRILGPVTAGNLLPTGMARLLISNSSQGYVAITATDAAITIGTHDRIYADMTLSVTGATLTVDDASAAIAAETGYYLYYDDGARAGGAVTWHATTDFFAVQNSDAAPDRHFGGWILTDVVGGTGTSGRGSIPGGTAGGDPYCVADDTPILLADGRELPAAQIRRGMVLRTRHEHSLDWGNYPVCAISFVEADVFACLVEGKDGPVRIRATGDHRFWLGGEWVLARSIGTPCGRARVARITVAGAHTYVSAGVLSHNIKITG